MRKLPLVVVLLAGCVDSTNSSIEIPFDLFASDELSTSSSGICGFTPVTQANGVYKGAGLLELDPALNPSPEYVLGLQVENYLQALSISDSNGNQVLGPQANDFHVQKAVVTYQTGANLAVSPSTVLVSGDVRVGGTQNASAVIVSAIPPNVAQAWASSFQKNNLASSEVVLEVQIFGLLGSGESTQTGVFDFPLTLCYNCGGIPINADGTPNCPGGSTAVTTNHGPCCATQDYEDVCVPCGAAGEPCCAGNSCASSSDTCGAITSSNSIDCFYTNEPQSACVSGS